MDVQSCLPDPERLTLIRTTVSAEVVWLEVESRTRSTPCPRCGQLSARPHSRYTRILKDLSLLGKRVRLRVGVRKFFCDHAACPQRIFCERLPTVALPRQRTTARLERQRQQVALEVGAESAARLLADLGSPVSADTLLRQLHQGVPPPAGQVRHLGIDDWAWRKGKRYGTILVDLERHQVIDLLPDRETDTLVAWLKLHPEVTLITRDRAGAYQEGATRGAPQAQQVADRWHLLKNLREALERYLQRVYDSLKPLGKALAQHDPEPSIPFKLPPEPAAVTGGYHPPTPRQQARFEQIKALLSQGGSVRQVARAAGVAAGTVRKYRALEHPPGIAVPRPRVTLLTPHLGWLNAQLSSGNHTAVKLYDQLREQGYRGGYTTLRAYCFQFRQDNPLEKARRAFPRFVCPSARTLSWALLDPTTIRIPLLTEFLEHCRNEHPELARVEQLFTQGWALFRRQSSLSLPAWLTELTHSGVKELQAFAVGIDRDFDAIQAALETPHSNGQVEGQVNRLKTLKRSMYGRASLALLKARVLYRATPRTAAFTKN
jgi:transposase